VAGNGRDGVAVDLWRTARVGFESGGTRNWRTPAALTGGETWLESVLDKITLPLARTRSIGRGSVGLCPRFGRIRCLRIVVAGNIPWPLPHHLPLAIYTMSCWAIMPRSEFRLIAISLGVALVAIANR